MAPRLVSKLCVRFTSTGYSVNASRQSAVPGDPQMNIPGSIGTNPVAHELGAEHGRKKIVPRGLKGETGYDTQKRFF
jgi:hypothetical protein